MAAQHVKRHTEPSRRLRHTAVDTATPVRQTCDTAVIDVGHLVPNCQPSRAWYSGVLPMGEVKNKVFNTLKSGQNELINLLIDNCCILIETSLKFVSEGPINTKLPLVQVIGWQQTGTKQLPEPIMTKFWDTSWRNRPKWPCYKSGHYIRFKLIQSMGSRMKSQSIILEILIACTILTTDNGI